MEIDSGKLLTLRAAEMFTECWGTAVTENFKEMWTSGKTNLAQQSSSVK